MNDVNTKEQGAISTENEAEILSQRESKMVNSALQGSITSLNESYAKQYPNHVAGWEDHLRQDAQNIITRTNRHKEEHGNLDLFRSPIMQGDLATAMCGRKYMIMGPDGKVFFPTDSELFMQGVLKEPVTSSTKFDHLLEPGKWRVTNFFLVGKGHIPVK